MSQPSIFQLPLWERYKRDIFEVIREALTILCSRPELPLLEDDPKKHSLNRELHRCFRMAYRKKKLQILHQFPTYDAKNPPFEDDNDPTKRENKRPDFHWDIVNHLASEDSFERRFTLECKRLGNLSERLNQKYVQNGIRRFITQPHEYGKQEDTCGMVGYIQSMDFDEVLGEVSFAITQNPELIAPLLPPVNGWQEKGISELEHQLERSFPISPFRLHHFWVDLRSNY